MNLYTKNKKGEFIPVNINNVLNKDLNNHLVVVRVGTDDFQATSEDLNLTADSFSKADVLDDLDNVSIIITPYQINIELLNKSEIDEKHICIQITGGDDISTLDKMTKSVYKQLKKRYNNTIVLPTPLKIEEYNQINDVLRRCEMKKNRRAKVYQT